MTKRELKEQWRENNWERKANGIKPITWAAFYHRYRQYRKVWEESK